MLNYREKYLISFYWVKLTTYKNVVSKAVLIGFLAIFSSTTKTEQLVVTKKSFSVCKTLFFSYSCIHYDCSQYLSQLHTGSEKRIISTSCVFFSLFIVADYYSLINNIFFKRPHQYALSFTEINFITMKSYTFQRKCLLIFTCIYAKLLRSYWVTSQSLKYLTLLRSNIK